METNIVIIDDDEDDINFLAQAIGKVFPDVNCFVYRSPAEAVMSLTEGDSDVIPNYVFVDYKMPRMNGIECVLALRTDERFEDTVITLVSSGMEDLDKKLFGRFGVNFWFSKPATFGAYAEMLNEVFAL